MCVRVSFAGGIDSFACLVRDGPWLSGSFREWNEERWAAGTPGRWVSDQQCFPNLLPYICMGKHDHGVMSTCLYPPPPGTLATTYYYESCYEHHTTRGHLTYVVFKLAWQMCEHLKDKW